MCECYVSNTKTARSQPPKFLLGGKMFDFRRTAVFLFGRRLSKCKMARYAKSLATVMHKKVSKRRPHFSLSRLSLSRVWRTGSLLSEAAFSDSERKFSKLSNRFAVRCTVFCFIRASITVVRSNNGSSLLVHYLFPFLLVFSLQIFFYLNDQRRLHESLFRHRAHARLRPFLLVYIYYDQTNVAALDLVTFFLLFYLPASLLPHLFESRPGRFPYSLCGARDRRPRAWLVLRPLRQRGQ